MLIVFSFTISTTYNSNLDFIVKLLIQNDIFNNFNDFFLKRIIQPN